MTAAVKYPHDRIEPGDARAPSAVRVGKMSASRSAPDRSQLSGSDMTITPGDLAGSAMPGSAAAVTRLAKSVGKLARAESSVVSSGSGSGEWQGFCLAFARPRSGFFNALARPPRFPAALRFALFETAFLCSRSIRSDTISSPSTSKNARISSAIRCQRRVETRATRASFFGSLGSRPPARHDAMSNSKYAPCCSVVRCAVSAR